MSLTKWSGYTFGDYTTEEQEPWMMSIIVRIEKSEAPTDAQVKRAVASALIEFFKSEQAHNIWKPSIERWLDGRIRKIAKRARGSEWDRVVNNVEGFKYAMGEAEVFIIPPHSVNDTHPDVKKLQVSGLDLEKYALEPMGLSRHTLFIALNPEVPMTTGKSLAQIGHAVQMAIFRNQPHVIEAWEKEGTPMFFVPWDNFNEIASQVMNEPVLEIHDAGFTEVASGSLTAKAVLVG